MQTLVERIKILVQEIFEEARKAADVPFVHQTLGRIPGGQIVSTMIRQSPPRQVKVDPVPVWTPPPRVSKAKPVAPTSAQVRVEKQPPKKATRGGGKSHSAKPPVPVGTLVRILTGAYKGWTGILQWSPAKATYNVRLTGPDGQRSRTTLSPNKRGSSWEVESIATTGKVPTQ